MRNGNSNHKPKRYSFPLPLVIKSDSTITITDGKAQLIHQGEILIRSASDQSIAFETFQPERNLQQGNKHGEEPQRKISPRITSLIESLDVQPKVPNGYSRLTTEKAKTASHGRERSIYEYYKRERDASYMVLVKRNGNIRPWKLGSLLKPDSTISIALKEFSREKPFYRRDLKPERMPSGLKHGQIIKACLSILSYEGFLDRTEILVGKKRKTDRYIRTLKRLP